MPRTYDEEMAFVEKAGKVMWRIKKDFVPNMNVSALNSHINSFSLIVFINVHRSRAYST